MIDGGFINDDMNVPSAKVLKTLSWLEDHDIPYEVHYHPPLFTIEECLAYWKDIHALEHMLHQGKLSFASPERMDRCLGVAPGSVCAFGLINDIDVRDTADPKELFDNGHRVKYFLDKDLQTAEKVSFHPCDNTASVVLSHDMFMKFLSLWGGEYEWLEI